VLRTLAQRRVSLSALRHLLPAPRLRPGYDLPLRFALSFRQPPPRSHCHSSSSAVRSSCPRHRRGPHVDLLATAPGPSIDGQCCLLLRLVALAYSLSRCSPVHRRSEPYRNIAPTLVWIIFWVRPTYVSAFAGDLWQLINPWRTLLEGGAALSASRRHRTVATAAVLAGARCLAGVLVLLVFAWIELVYPSPAVPAHIAVSPPCIRSSP